MVEHYEGFVARYIGDGILVYFGYPNAHEDDAERAVRAGLEIVRAISTKQSKKVGWPFDRCPRGPNRDRDRARRCGRFDRKGHRGARFRGGRNAQFGSSATELAPPNGVVIASSTQSLLRAKFEYENLGSHALKGLSEPVQAWHVVRPPAWKVALPPLSAPN